MAMLGAGVLAGVGAAIGSRVGRAPGALRVRSATALPFVASVDVGVLAGVRIGH